MGIVFSFYLQMTTLHIFKSKKSCHNKSFVNERYLVVLGIPKRLGNLS